jgi:hypothetical protein
VDKRFPIALAGVSCNTDQHRGLVSDRLKQASHFESVYTFTLQPDELYKWVCADFYEAAPDFVFEFAVDTMSVSQVARVVAKGVWTFWKSLSGEGNLQEMPCSLPRILVVFDNIWIKGVENSDQFGAQTNVEHDPCFKEVVASGSRGHVSFLPLQKRKETQGDFMRMVHALRTDPTTTPAVWDAEFGHRKEIKGLNVTSDQLPQQMLTVFRPYDYAVSSQDVEDWRLQLRAYMEMVIVGHNISGPLLEVLRTFFLDERRIMTIRPTDGTGPRGHLFLQGRFEHPKNGGLLLAAAVVKHLLHLFDRHRVECRYPEAKSI